MTRQKADSESDFFVYYSFANLLELDLGVSVEIQQKHLLCDTDSPLLHRGKIAKSCLVFQWNEQACDNDEDLIEC